MSPSAVAALKLVGLGALLGFVATVPIYWVSLTAGAAFAYAVMSGVRWSRFLRRYAPIVAIAGVMTAGAIWSRPHVDDDRAIQAGVRALVAGFILVAFSERTSTSEVLLGMKRLRAPSLLVTSLMLMLRSLDILNVQRKAILRSRAARGGERTSIVAEWRGRAGLIGLLLARAVDRSERVHRAMKARGWSADRG